MQHRRGRTHRRARRRHEGAGARQHVGGARGCGQGAGSRGQHWRRRVGIVEDVLVKVDKFYYLVDFVVLDTEPIASGPNHVPIILGRPFLATSNAIINCRNGVMQLTFGNMTLELNIFHLSNKHKLVEDDKQGADEVCSIGQNAGKPKAPKLQAELVNQDEAVDGELSVSVTPAELMVSPKSPNEKKFNKKGSSRKAAAQATAGIKELLLLDPP